MKTRARTQGQRRRLSVLGVVDVSAFVIGRVCGLGRMCRSRVASPRSVLPTLDVDHNVGHFTVVMVSGVTRALLVVFAGAAFGCGSAEGSDVAVADGPVPIAEVAPLNGKSDNHLMVLTSADAYRSYFGRENPNVDFAEEWVVHYSAKPGYGIAILGAEIRFGRLDIQTVSMPLDCAGDLTLKDNVTVRMPKQDPAAMPHVETRTIVASTCASLSRD